MDVDGTSWRVTSRDPSCGQVSYSDGCALASVSQPSHTVAESSSGVPSETRSWQAVILVRNKEVEGQEGEEMDERPALILEGATTMDPPEFGNELPERRISSAEAVGGVGEGRRDEGNGGVTGDEVHLLTTSEPMCCSVHTDPEALWRGPVEGLSLIHI